MMSYLRRALRDLASLRNLDLHLVSLGIPVAILFWIWSIRGVDYSKYAPATILWFIGFLATGILADRWSREEYQSRLHKTVWKDHEEEFRDKISRATDVCILAVSPFYFLREYQSELAKVLSQKDGRVRLLFVDKDERAMQLIKLGRPENAEHSKLFFDGLKTLLPAPSGASPTSLRVKSLNYVPSCIMTIIDSDKHDGAIFVTTYSFNQVENRPSTMLTRSERAWYAFYQQEFENLWNARAEVVRDVPF
jgi:hypothetical protein